MPIKGNDLVIIPNADETTKPAKDPAQVFGNLKLGGFEEEVSGINLSKLFSVYGPQSTQQAIHKKETINGMTDDSEESEEDSDDEDEEPLII